MTETHKVYQAINRVQAALAKEGISKNRKNQQQGYNFRGIDDIYNALSSLLAEHGLCILPRILSRECVERTTKSGGTLFYTIVEAEFDFVCAEDGSTHVVRTYGEAMDSGDKSCNKAMSAAYKYAAMQAFAIPTEGDNDADAVTHEVAPASVEPPKPVAARTTTKKPVEPAKPSMPQACSDAIATLKALGCKSADDYRAVIAHVTNKAHTPEQVKSDESVATALRETIAELTKTQTPKSLLDAALAANTNAF